MTDQELQSRLTAYRASMSLAEDMWVHGIITDCEYRKIDRIIADKYGLDSSTIFCRNPLIISQYYGNIAQNGR